MAELAEQSQQSQQWHPEDIKAAVRKKGKTLTELATDNGLDPSTLAKALKSPSKAGEIAISEYLSIPLCELFPKRWTKEGKRIRPRYAHKYSTKEV